MEKEKNNPEFKKRAFTCFHCHAYSKQDWNFNYINEKDGDFYGTLLPTRNQSRAINLNKDTFKELYTCKCQNCGKISFWYDGKLCWPIKSPVEPAHKEMPEDIKKMYNEASDIVELSPRASCAILRVGLQKLCNGLAGVDENESINNSIKTLVDRGLPKNLQQAFDIIRIVGNEAVHPGTIDFEDNQEIAYSIFKLMNIIVEKMIEEPNEIEELYSRMPGKKLKGIYDRDNK